MSRAQAAGAVLYTYVLYVVWYASGSNTRLQLKLISLIKLRKQCRLLVPFLFGERARLTLTLT